MGLTSLPQFCSGSRGYLAEAHTLPQARLEGQPDPQSALGAATYKLGSSKSFEQVAHLP